MYTLSMLLTALVPIFVILAIFIPVIMAMKLIYTSLNQDLINDRESYEELLNSVAISWLEEIEQDEWTHQPGDVYV
ncbi:hypothetical protein CAEBREN_02180 [Caenorhabditis brenneri]|uniref:Uncharacterized protein n=1 Tax=Caenorhabditis brenneri TaxID=135651 RepID=G0NSQ8_CAEBE|nr:hypothetical protein CAEBREN_02180 [Caenorhabditis brenneri]